MFLNKKEEKINYNKIKQAIFFYSFFRLNLKIDKKIREYYTKLSKTK